MAETETEHRPPATSGGTGLKKKWHGAPVWVWVLGGTVIAAVGYFEWKKRKGAKTGATTGTTTPTSGTGACYDMQGNLVPCATSSGTSPLGSGSSGLGQSVGGWYGGGGTTGTTTSTGTTGTGSTGSSSGTTGTGGTGGQSGTVPACTGLTAGAAHNAIVAANLTPVAAPGQKSTWICTGTQPSAGTVLAAGSNVTILANAPSTSSGTTGTGSNDITTAPGNFKVTSVNGLTVSLSWTAPPLPAGQGPIRSYIVAYGQSPSSLPYQQTVPPTQTSTSITFNSGPGANGLTHYFEVWADPAKTGGPHAGPISATTK